MINTLPTKEACYALFEKHGMLPNIQEHSKLVARVAKRVALHIQESGTPVDIDLAETGALLHDVAKTITITGKGKNHGKLGSDIVLEEGYGTDLANTILHHVLEAFHPSLTIEEQIVNYADKRVKHDAIVSLKDRFDDIKIRYPAAKDSLDTFAPRFYQFEEKYGLDSLMV